jgi:hypothetical protein
MNRVTKYEDYSYLNTQVDCIPNDGKHGVSGIHRRLITSRHDGQEYACGVLIPTVIVNYERDKGLLPTRVYKIYTDRFGDTKYMYIMVSTSDAKRVYVHNGEYWVASHFIKVREINNRSYNNVYEKCVTLNDKYDTEQQNMRNNFDSEKYDGFVKKYIIRKPVEPPYDNSEEEEQSEDEYEDSEEDEEDGEQYDEEEGERYDENARRRSRRSMEDEN